MEWHIDAWDTNAGRAFATQRSRNSDIGQMGEEVLGPTVFIGPPSFRPEQIANIGIALSARRSGAFDPRVPLNPETDEIQFATADAVADFVRRAFTGSTRNRGDDGGGVIGFEGGPEDPPPSDGGEPSFAERFLGEWMSGLERLDQHPIPLALFHGNPVPYTFEPPAYTPAPSQLDAVQRGALQILATMLDGIPRFGLNSSWFAQWQEAAMKLDAAISELGLWNVWFTSEGAIRQTISQYLSIRTLTLVPRERQADIDGITFAQLALRWQPTTADPDKAAAQFMHSLELAIYEPIWFGGYFASVQSNMADRYEALFTWPLPSYVTIEPACRSVGELLATFVSSPSTFAKSTPGTIDIIMFAAALLASRIENRQREGWRERAAATWLAKSLPRWQFRPDIEALILEPGNQRVMAMAGT